MNEGHFQKEKKKVRGVFYNFLYTFHRSWAALFYFLNDLSVLQLDIFIMIALTYKFILQQNLVNAGYLL